MTKKSKTVIFFGSGPVAAKSLELLAKDFEIEAVVTKPVPPHHRSPAPVIELCHKLGLKALTVTNSDELDKLISSKVIKSELGILIDFGIIVSDLAISYFPLGIVNSHFSLLPHWRGADPITFSVLSGQKQTGISLMLLVRKMDEGPLLAQATYEIPENITTPDLTEDLITLSNETLKQVLPLYLEGKASPAPQEEVTLAESKIPTYSRKLSKEDGRINWNKPAREIEREVRAFQGWPGSFTQLAGKDVTILQASVINENGEPGSIRRDKKELVIYCGEGALSIEKIKPAGKKEMEINQFLAGYGNSL